MSVVVTLTIGGASYHNNNSQYGGWSFIARYANRGLYYISPGTGPTEQFGAIGPVYSSRQDMELVAAIKGLESLEEDRFDPISQVILVSDNQSLVDAANSLRLRCRDNGWTTFGGSQFLNLDLWRLLDERCNLRNVTARRRTGRDFDLERCDDLAKAIAVVGKPQLLIEALERRIGCAVNPSMALLDAPLPF